MENDAEKSYFPNIMTRKIDVNKYYWYRPCHFVVQKLLKTSFVITIKKKEKEIIVCCLSCLAKNFRSHYRSFSYSVEASGNNMNLYLRNKQTNIEFCVLKK